MNVLELKPYSQSEPGPEDKTSATLSPDWVRFAASETERARIACSLPGRSPEAFDVWLDSGNGNLKT